MSTPLKRDVASERLPITVVWPIRDEGEFVHWLVPGDWTRGRAIGHVRDHEHYRLPFTEFRARRCWLRWSHLDCMSAGWRFPDGTLVSSDRSDPDAEPYWEVTRR